MGVSGRKPQGYGGQVWGYNIYIGDIEIKCVSLQLEIKILNIVIK